MAPNSEDHPATRPGVQYIKNDEAARFDERIAEKRNKNAPAVSSNKNDVDVDDMEDMLNAKPPSRPTREASDIAAKNLKPPARPTREESDIAAKNRAKASAQAARPMMIDNDDVDVDDDVQAKRRAKASRAVAVPRASGVRTKPVPSANGKNLATLDRDIEAKNQARRAVGGGGGVAKKPVAKLTTAMLLPEDNNSSNKNKADDAAAKNQARAQSGPAMIPGAFAERSNTDPSPQKSASSRGGGGNVDADALAKQNAASSSPRFIAFDDDDNDRMTEKTNASFGGGGSPEKSTEAGAVAGDPYDEEWNGKLRAIGVRPSGTVPAPPTDGGVAGDMGQVELGGTNQSVDEADFIDVEDNKLAIATAVEEDEEDDDAFIPAAVEFDPNSKPSLFQNRRFRCYAALAFVLVMVGITAIVVPTKVVQDNRVSGPTMAPTTFRESLGIQDQIERVIGSSKLYEVDSPYNKALEWILHGDAMQLAHDAENLMQRYTLALFYFLTSQEAPWRSCNPPMGNETADCGYANIVGIAPELQFEPVPRIRWLSDRSECEWAGVGCENSKVNTLDIRGQKLSGSFPEELGNLPFLRDINLAWNELRGKLPTSLASNMKQLANIELHSNFFTGTIPSEYFSFIRLNRFNLGLNKLSGPLIIPPDARLESLKGIFLYENELTGPIPSEIAVLSTLTYLRLSKNGFTGSLPTEFGLLTDLQEVWLHKTLLNGPIPSEVGNMAQLHDLRLQDTGMSGQIPEELYDLEMLERIDLYDSSFSGTISTKIGLLSSLDVLRLRGNAFEGTLPSELNLLTELRQVWLHHTDVEGGMPEGLCQLRNTTLYELVADCLVDTSTGLAAVDCPDGCCTGCCDAQTGSCEAM